MTTPATEPGPFDPEGVVWQRVSTRLIRARMVSVLPVVAVPAVIAALAAIGTGVGWPWFVVAALAGIALWIVWVIPRQVRAYGYAERHDDLLIRRGVMFRSLVVVPYGRMQFVDVQAGPVDRWCDIAAVKLHTASVHTDAHIAGLAPAEAARLRDRLASRGEAQLAGL